MAKKESVHSFKDAYENFMAENEENINKQKTIKYYGVDLPYELMNDIEILEQTTSKITYLNKQTNEIVTSNLISRIFEKWATHYSVSLNFEDKNKNLFTEYYNSIFSAQSYEEAGKLALAARKNPDSKLLNRAYADVKTKYGEFCLHVEETYTDYQKGPYRFIALYHGNHEKLINKYSHDFEFNKYCLGKWKYMDSYNFSQWLYGYVDEYFGGPRMNNWQYGVSENTDVPIYSFEDRLKNYSGVILKDGKLVLADNLYYIPEIFNFYRVKDQLEKYEDLACASKAYFANYAGDCLAIMKNNSIIKIEYKKENHYTGKWKKEYTDTFTSNTAGYFTKEDLTNVIAKLSEAPIRKEFKEFVIGGLTTICNNNENNDLSDLGKYSLENVTFEDMLAYIKEQDLVSLVENGLEKIAQTFGISVEDLLGDQTFKNNQGKTLSLKDY